MYNQATFEGLLSVISSPASAGGPTPCDLQDGQRTGQSGPGAARASRSVARGNNAAQQTSGTCGQSLQNSSEPASLQRFLESRLRARLGGNGSPEYSLTWKQWAISGQEPICALRASGHRTSGKDCSGWPTPDANAMNLGESLDTFQARQKELKQKHGNGNGAGMPIAIASQLAGWPTCRAEDSESTGAHRGVPDTLTSAARVAGWATPATRDYKDTGDMSESMVRRDGQERNDTVPRQAFGMTPSVTPAETGKPGAYQLNPRFSLWLMGYPVEWACCGELAMQSFRKSRRSS